LTYLLDTNACVEYLNGRSLKMMDAFRRHVPGEIAVCSIVKAELHYGVQRSRSPQDALAKLGTFLLHTSHCPLTTGAPRRTVAFGRVWQRWVQSSGPTTC